MNWIKICNNKDGGRLGVIKLVKENKIERFFELAWRSVILMRMCVEILTCSLWWNIEKGSIGEDLAIGNFICNIVNALTLNAIGYWTCDFEELVFYLVRDWFYVGSWSDKSSNVS